MIWSHVGFHLLMTRSHLSCEHVSTTCLWRFLFATWCQVMGWSRCPNFARACSNWKDKRAPSIWCLDWVFLGFFPCAEAHCGALVVGFMQLRFTRTSWSSAISADRGGWRHGSVPIMLFSLILCLLLDRTGLTNMSQNHFSSRLQQVFHIYVCVCF